jgi:beta-lactamase regulating signal transducer with metallopeptidase domain
VAELVLAWLATVAVHSTVLLALAALLSRLRLAASIRELVWSSGLLGGLLTATAQVAWLRVPAAMPGAGAVEGPWSWTAGPLATLTGEAAPAAGIVWPATDAVLGVLAFGGFVLCCGLRLLRHATLRRFLHPRTPAPAPVPGLLAALALRFRAPLPRVSVHPALGSPIAFRWLAPEICLPERALALQPPALLAMLAHELAHVLRRDALRRALTEAAVALLWWQPLAWLARRELHRTAELQCDEIAACAAGPLHVARSLVEVAGWVIADAVPAGSTAMAAGSPLSERVSALLGGRQASAGRLAHWTGRALAAAAWLGAVWVLPGERLPESLPAAPPAAMPLQPVTQLEALQESRQALHEEFGALRAELAGGASPQQLLLLDEIRRRLTRIELRWRELQQSLRSGPASVNHSR